jgi:CBS domain-containing protein
MAELDPVAFLRATPPFDTLPPPDFDRAAAALEVVFHPAGGLVIARDGPPSGHLFLVRKGLVRLERDGQTVLVLEPGDLFGFTSVLAETTAFDVVAGEDLLAYRVPAGVVRGLLVHPAFARYFTESLAERLRWTAEPVRALAGGDLYLPVGTLVHRDALMVAPDTTVAETARRMSEARVSSALVEGDPLGIATDRDLRNRVLAAGRSPDTCIAEVATRPVRTVSASAPVHEAWHALVEHGVHHLPVVRDGTVIGVISDTDLLRHQTSGPSALFARIERIQHGAALEGYAAENTRMVRVLLESGLDVLRIARLVSRLNDALVARLLRLAVAELGEPPCAYAWVVFGAEGRYEQLLITDQDNALVYEAGVNGARDYFARLGARVVADLEAAGFSPCPGGCMATRWCDTRDGWVDRVLGWIREPTGPALLDAATFVDGRRVCGQLDLAPVQRAVGAARGDERFLARLANEALRFSPPIGAFGRLRDADHLDLKRDGLAPIAGLARVHALAVGSRAHSTPERLSAAAAAGAISDEAAVTLTEAYRFLLTLRLRAQLQAAETGRGPGNLVTARGLRAVDVRHLKEAFRAIRDAQAALALRYRTDRF